MYTHTCLTSPVLNTHEPAVQKGKRAHLRFPPRSLTVDLSQAPVRSQASAVPLINIRYDPVGRLHHLNRVPTKQLPLILDELAPEPAVGPDDRAASFDPGVGFGQRHTVILHEVRQTQ